MEILGGDLSDQFGEAVKNLQKKIMGTKEYAQKFTAAKTAEKKAKEFLRDYIEIARNKKGPYNRNEYPKWLQSFTAKNWNPAVAALSLSSFRIARESGLIGDAVWNPFDWFKTHPEDEKDWKDKLLEGIGSQFSKFALIGIGALVLFGVLKTGVRAAILRR